MTADELELARSQVKELRECDAKMTPGEWTYRPYKHDDWGLIRSADGSFELEGFPHGMPLFSASMAPYHDTMEDHRKSGIDPAGPDSIGVITLRNSAAAFARSLESLLAERDALAAKCGELESEIKELRTQLNLDDPMTI